MARAKYYMDWIFKDLNGRKGKYVIAEAPNLPLIIFTVFIILAVVVYPGFFQTLCAFIAYAALLWWGIAEARSGRSRFRKLLGYAGILAVAGALLLRLGF
ncbi:MAG TPA: hypothetical protein VF572_04990 [Candidatus Saccharimonadales bacterium]|jgi:energy-coupling factor transporter transmembrane protein EcfT